MLKAALKAEQSLPETGIEGSMGVVDRVKRKLTPSELPHWFGTFLNGVTTKLEPFVAWVTVRTLVRLLPVFVVILFVVLAIIALATFVT